MNDAAPRHRRLAASVLHLTTLAVVLVAHADDTHAAGLFLPGIGPQSQSRAGAFVAKADDPSALANNPAGLARIKGTVLYLGASLIDFDLKYQRAGTYETSTLAPPYAGQAYPLVEESSSPELGLLGTQLIPTFALATDFGGGFPLHAAVGLFAPTGYPGRAFPETYDVGGGVLAPGPQRYDVIRQDVTAALPSLAVSYEPVDWLAAGIRFTWGVFGMRSKVALWAARNYEEAPERDGVFEADVADNFVPGLGLGILTRSPMGIPLELGVSWSSPLSVAAQGEGRSTVGPAATPGIPETIEPVPDSAARCAPGGTIGALAACVSLTIPQTLSFGARYVIRDGEGKERGDVELDAQWEQWSAGSDYEVIVDGRSGASGIPLQPTLLRHGLNDAWSIRLGGSYAFDLFGGELRASLGAAYDTAAAPDSFTRVDFDGSARWNLAGGLRYAWGRLAFEAGAGWVLSSERQVAQCAPPDGPNDAAPGCAGNGRETPMDERLQPDPSQPTLASENSVESPFNAGAYTSRYVLLHLGMSVRF